MERRLELDRGKAGAVRLELAGVDLLYRRIRIEQGRPRVEEDGADRG